jgi:hypothetical protein
MGIDEWPVEIKELACNARAMGYELFPKGKRWPAAISNNAS